MKVGLLYMPALHEGVIQLLKKWRGSGVERIFVLGKSLTHSVRGVPRDFPVSPETMAACVDTLGIFSIPCGMVHTYNLEMLLAAK